MCANRPSASLQITITGAIGNFFGRLNHLSASYGDFPCHSPDLPRPVDSRLWRGGTLQIELLGQVLKRLAVQPCAASRR